MLSAVVKPAAETKGLIMRTRSARQISKIVTAPLLGIAISLFALGGVASAHVVTSINADCYQVTVHFNDFPDSGVMVHIAADVNGQVISTDVQVTSTTTSAQLDISAATAPLAATPANIDVDATWTYLGPQHAHEAFTLTCGTATTTASSTTTTQAPTTTTSVIPTTTTEVVTTTTAPPVTTSTQVRGTTVVATTTAPASTTTGTVSRQGTTVVATTTTVPGAATLPRTGSTPTFALVFGFSSLVAGAMILLRQRGVWSR
jgi:LPXTG-motif cell wall-anchored protein